jgi:hypothetical protein
MKFNVFILLFFSLSVENVNSAQTVFERVYLHLDKHYYLSGDNIWFKAYLIDAQTNKLSQKSSRILYAELISPDARILERKILYVDSTGCSIGDFRVRNSAVSGKYRIRAYTKWMLNFGDVFVYEKEIEVKNNPDELDQDTKKKRKKKEKETAINPSEDIEIEFFPESGSMVSGIENIIAFKATDRYGKGANVSGGVLNSDGDTVSLFTSEYLGMGKFVLTPQEGESYLAFFMSENILYPFFAQLPEYLHKGFTINVTDNDTAFLLNIRTNPETFKEFSHKKILIVFRRAEKFLFAHETILDEDSKFLNLSKSLLPAGITRIILYDEHERPYCERLVYIENEEKIKVNITPANDSTSIIKLINNKGLPVQANLSTSVTSNLIPDATFNIESYLWLESEIKGKIERPVTYFDTTNANRFKNMDLLILTQGWRDFVWIHVANDTAVFAGGYYMEHGLKMSGHVKKPFGKKPYTNADIFMYFPHLGLDKGIRYTKTDSLGNYDFGYVDFWGNQSIFINSKLWKKSRMDIHPKYKDVGEIFIYPLCMPEEQFPVKILQHYQTDSTHQFSVENYRTKKHKLNDTIVLDPVKITGRNVKGWLISDKEITPKDESVWMSLDSYVGGIVPCLIIKQCRNIHIANYNYFDIDGKQIYNRVPPSKISIKEVDRVVMYRKDEFNGLHKMKHIYTINVFAKNGKFSTMRYPTKIFVRSESGGIYAQIIDTPKSNSMSLAVTGYYEARRFYTPKFNNNVEIRDYFGTYFWQADVRTDTNGEGVINYNPQKQPSGKIYIEGITDDGIPFAVKLK